MKLDSAVKDLQKEKQEVENNPATRPAPVSEAELYGDCKNHPRGHIDRWRQMQMTGVVTSDLEYEEPPRGRVIYNVKERQFLLLADSCILKKRNLVKKIMEELQLPADKTKCDTDPHYRCNKCLGFEI
jgi:hypothetical protein